LGSQNDHNAAKKGQAHAVSILLVYVRDSGSGQVLALWHGEYSPTAVFSVKLEHQMYPTFPFIRGPIIIYLVLNTSIGRPPVVA
jgi:hypothetical protein